MKYNQNADEDLSYMANLFPVSLRELVCSLRAITCNNTFDIIIDNIIDDNTCDYVCMCLDVTCDLCL